MYHNNHITVVIPAFNEQESLPKVLSDIPKGIADEIIVVDNNSTDETASVATRCGAKVVREERAGYGAACLRGISEIKHTDILVILDGDYSDYPQQMSQILDPIVKQEADFVLGSRVLGNRQKGALMPQAYWGNKLSVFLIKLFFGFSFTDMGPFRAIRFQSLKELNMRDANFGWNVEMQVKAIKRGLKIREVPVDYRVRIGSSKISGTIRGTILAGTKILFTIFKYIIYA